MLAWALESLLVINACNVLLVEKKHRRGNQKLKPTFDLLFVLLYLVLVRLTHISNHKIFVEVLLRAPNNCFIVSEPYHGALSISSRIFHCLPPRPNCCFRTLNHFSLDNIKARNIITHPSRSHQSSRHHRNSPPLHNSPHLTHPLTPPSPRCYRSRSQLLLQLQNHHGRSLHPPKRTDHLHHAWGEPRQQ